MQLLSIAITLVVVVLVSAMILKKYKPHAILLGGGIVLLLSAQFLGINNIITDVEKSTGFWLFDVFEKHAPHSRYFSDELGALFIYNNIEHMFTYLVTYGIIFIWKKIYLLLKKILFRMVEDMCTRFNIIWSGARNTERKF